MLIDHSLARFSRHCESSVSGLGSRSILRTITLFRDKSFSRDNRFLYYCWNVPRSALPDEAALLLSITNSPKSSASFIQTIGDEGFTRFSYSALEANGLVRETFYLHGWPSHFFKMYDSNYLACLHEWEVPTTLAFDVVGDVTLGQKTYSLVTPASITGSFLFFLRKRINFEIDLHESSRTQYITFARRFDAEGNLSGWKVEINFPNEILTKLPNFNKGGFGNLEEFISINLRGKDSLDVISFDFSLSWEINKITFYERIDSFD